MGRRYDSPFLFRNTMLCIHWRLSTVIRLTWRPRKWLKEKDGTRFPFQLPTWEGSQQTITPCIVRIEVRKQRPKLALGMGMGIGKGKGMVLRRERMENFRGVVSTAR